MCTPERRRAGGFSLVEAIIAIVILSIATVGVLLVYTSASRGSADALINKQALAVAEAMLEEIQLTAFDNPSGGFSGAATQANWQNFDDVSDYNGFTTTGVFTIDGVAAIPGLAGYDVAVTVVPTAFSGIGAVDTKLITVTVTNPAAGVTVNLAGYRINYP
jgi:MSHA pilin protein MshD